VQKTTTDKNQITAEGILGWFKFNSNLKNLG